MFADQRNAGGALQGVRVIELTHAIAGPHAGQMMADHGADVIKVEPPDGELARTAYPEVAEESIYFASHNRGKRSVVLDLKTEDGSEALRELCRGADLVLTNYADGVPQRLGFGYDALAALDPGLILVHVTGFGAGADWAPRGAYDGVIQAMSGVADLSGAADGPPTFSGVFPADHLTAYHAVTGALLALRERDRTGRGQCVEINMLASYQTLLAHEVGLVAEGTPSTRVGNRIPGAFAEVFDTRDGAVFISPLAQPTWERFWAALGEPDLARQVPYTEALEDGNQWLRDHVVCWAAARDTAEVRAILDQAAIPNGPMTTVADAVARMISAEDGQVRHVTSPGGRRITAPGPPLRVGLAEDERTLRVPAVGEHTEEVLAPLLDAVALARITGEVASTDA